MADTKDHSKAGAIPVFDFYGETRDWPIYDLVHCEPLSVRSAEHNWHINSHRHEDLLQIFYVSRGTGEASVDGETFSLMGKTLLVIPTQSVHTLTWSTDSEGYVLLIASPLMQKLGAVLESPPWSKDDRLIYQTGVDADFLRNTMDAIAREYGGNQVHRVFMVENLVSGLLVWLDRQRQLELKQRHKLGKAEAKLAKFLDLIERHFQHHHDVAWYADKLGVTPPHLNTICRKHRGETALRLIHNRILLEAQRLLLYTGQTAAEVCLALGFSDPAYFNRFFKRLAGVTPGKFKSNN